MKNLPIITLIVVAVIALGAFAFYSQPSEEGAMPETTKMMADSPSDEVMVKPEDSMEKPADAMEKPADSMEKATDTMDKGVMEKTDDTAAPTVGSYVAYTPTIIKEAAQTGKTVVLFFHAGWCPTCKSADKDFTSRIGEIPSNLVVVKVDYDTEKDLKKKYNVTYQHTFVQVDAEGMAVTTWNGGDLDEVLSKTGL